MLFRFRDLTHRGTSQTGPLRTWSAINFCISVWHSDVYQNTTTLLLTFIRSRPMQRPASTSVISPPNYIFEGPPTPSLQKDRHEAASGKPRTTAGEKGRKTYEQTD